MKKIIYLFLSTFMLLDSIHANDSEMLEPYFKVGDSSKNKKKVSNEPLDGIDISFDQIFKYEDQQVIEIEKRTNQTIQDSSVKRESGFYLGKDEYIELRGLDKRRKLFNGSIIIEFNRMPNLNAFALENEISLVADLSDINRGVFKVSNLYELKDKINELQSNQNVLSIGLDTLNPDIKVR